MDDIEAFDPEGRNQELWTQVLVFPNPSKLDDAGLDYHFRDYDGRWSAQTKRAMKAFGADGLELNSNWALERQRWTCPGCQRSKFEVFRKSSNGILLAKLELHHDHMSDEAAQRPAIVAGPEWKAALGDGGSRVMDTIRALVVRFDTALVCSECNAADGKAKKLVDTDPRFTFAVTEIRQFIKATPHHDHEVDVEIARAVWEAERPAFEHRLALLASLVDDVFARRLQNKREGALPYGRSMIDRCETDETLRNSFWKSARGSRNRSLLNAMKADFLSRSVSKDIAKRDVPQAPPRVPTDDEYTSFVPEFGIQNWTEVDDDWACPCCVRGKRASMRMSSKKKWTAAIRSVAQYDILLDEDEIMLRERLFPDFANDLHLVERRWVAVCSDCADITTRVGQSRRDLPAVFLTMDEMMTVLSSVRGHACHGIDLDRGATLASANLPYRQAIDAMSAFINLRDEFRRLMKKGANGPEERRRAFEELDFRLEVHHSIDDPQERKEIMAMIKDGNYGVRREVEVAIGRPQPSVNGRVRP